MCDNIRLYHVDHLGSTSLVTDIDGEITQHVAYIPYGEIFVEQRNGSWNTPYLFNAKELDEETGLYYYGARYLDPTHAAWLSVDPLFEKFTGVSPYAYCHNNPIGRIDPNGMFDSEEEAYDFSMKNNIDAMITQREDGTYQLYDVNNHEAIYHDENGNLNTIMECVTVAGKREEHEPCGWIKFWRGADEVADDILCPIISGATSFLPPIGLTNDIYTLNGRDIFGNETSGLDKSFAGIDLATFGIGKVASIAKFVKPSIKSLRIKDVDILYGKCWLFETSPLDYFDSLIDVINGFFTSKSLFNNSSNNTNEITPEK